MSEITKGQFQAILLSLEQFHTTHDMNQLLEDLKIILGVNKPTLEVK